VAKRGKAVGSEPAATPIKGALTLEEGDDENSIPLKMLLNTLQQMETQRKLEAQAMQAVLNTQTETLKQLQQQMAEEKRKTSQALDALQSKMAEIMEAKPDDPKVRETMVRQAVAEAKKNIPKRRKTFLAELKKQPTGTLNNDEGVVIRLGINGIYRDFLPGPNEGVPQSFLELWQQRKETKRWATQADLALQAQPEANAMRPGSWNEDTGRVL
jgi:hypothetical protein